MGYTLSDIAAHVGGELFGDPEYVVTSLGSLDCADADQLAFLSNPKFANQLSSCEAGAVLLRNQSDVDQVRNAILVRNPYLAFAQATQLFLPKEQGWKDSIHPSAVIHDTAILGDNVVIGPNVTVGAYTELSAGCHIGSGSVLGEGVKIAENTRIAANVTLYDNVVIGARWIIHSGVVIGADGFGFAPHEGRWEKIHQLGSVVMGD